MEPFPHGLRMRRQAARFHRRQAPRGLPRITRTVASRDSRRQRRRPHRFRPMWKRGKPLCLGLMTPLFGGWHRCWLRFASPGGTRRESRKPGPRGLFEEMKERIRQLLRRLILWACPEMASLTREAPLAGDFAPGAITSPGAHATSLAARPLDIQAPRLGAATSPAGGHASHAPRRPLGGAHVWVLIFLMGTAVRPLGAAPDPSHLAAVRNAFRGYSNPFYLGEPGPIRLAALAQGGSSVSGGNPQFDASGNLKVNCLLGCSASAGFSDNSAFTVGSTAINVVGALYTTSTPAISSGNAGRVRMDGSSFLMVNCQVGCSGSGFADNSAFTASTTAIGITGGWYSTSPTNCTSGSACAPQLTQDRKLFTQAFQGTSPWVVGITSWGGGTLGAMANYGTSPGAVLVPGVNAFITNSPTVTANAGINLNTSALMLDASKCTAASGGAPPANGCYAEGLGSGATGGNLVGLPVSDTYKAINIATATTTLLITGISGRQVRIGAIHFIAAGADNVALIEGTGSTCGTGTAGMAGGTTSGSGYNLVANQGYTFGSGLGTVIQTVTAGDSVCAVTSAAVQLSGGIEYTIY